MKSKASDPLELLQYVYNDACNKCIADVYDYRDLETIESRVKNEGLSFLTITLPNFARDFERSLEIGFVDSSTFPGSFQGFRKIGAIPAFLQGMLSQIFDRDTGVIYDVQEDTPTIVESVRQLCLTFKKLEVDCSPKKIAAAFNSFTEIERSFDMFSLPENFSIFLEISDILWSDALMDINPFECRPKHGPGATAEGISGNQKYNWQFWHDRLEPYFPLIHTAYPLGTPEDAEVLKSVTMLAKDQERPVRVIAVPKNTQRSQNHRNRACVYAIYTTRGSRRSI